MLPRTFSTKGFHWSIIDLFCIVITNVTFLSPVVGIFTVCCFFYSGKIGEVTVV